jgi:hypothetical protein
MVAEGLRPKPTRGFKPKRKMVFKPKVVVGLGTRAKGVKPSSSWKLLEKASSPLLAEDTSFASASTSACVAGVLSQLVLGIFPEELSTSLRIGDMGPSRLASVRGRVVSGGMGTSEVGDFSIISPERSGRMGPRMAEVLLAMVGEETCSTILETSRLVKQFAKTESLKTLSMQELELDLVKAQGMKDPRHGPKQLQMYQRSRRSQLQRRPSKPMKLWVSAL